ncbi:MerR family transcriptional regulator [Paenibacillus wenxiniae]|uniref:MerR family transcriptional regulator n=1 Tax=Paenibacillus wenxiniae TaxID=1636843 RepID=A0ABW4RQF6_9BACL
MNGRYALKQTAMLSGLSKDTILFYEKIGLIPTTARNELGYRVYSQEDIDTLNLIACLKRTGMSLEDIKSYLQLEISEERYQRLHEHKEKLAQQMMELQNVIDIKLNKIKLKNEQEHKPNGV